jgi:predicted nucleic acid-binding protein
LSAGLDTSVVVRLLIGEPESQATRARQFLDECIATGQGPARISDLVASETYFALIHHYGVPLADALRALGELLADERISASPSVRRVFDAPDLATAVPGFLDRLIHEHYSDQGASLVTFDKTAARLPGARLLR